MGLFHFLGRLFGRPRPDPRTADGDASRREFLVTVQGVALGAFRLPALPGCDPGGGPAAAPPTRQVLGPVQKFAVGDSFHLLWTEMVPGGEVRVMVWHPETRREVADANRLYNASRGLAPDGSPARRVRPGKVARRGEDERRLIRAVLDAPDADRPYLDYADWLDARGDPYGGFLRAMAALRKLPESDPAHTGVWSVAHAYLEKHGRQWAKPLTDLGFEPLEVPFVDVPFAFRVELWFDDRGVISSFTVANPGVFPDHADRFFAAVPFLRRLKVEADGTDLAAVAVLPPMGRIEELSGSTTAEGFEALVRSPHLGRLRKLEVGGELGVFAGHALAASPLLGRLRHLRLSYAGLEDSSVIALVTSPACRELRHLSLASNGMTGEGLAAIGCSPHLTNLETLVLISNRFHPEAYQYLRGAAFRRTLKALNLADCGMDRRAVDHLAAAGFERLEELTLSGADLGGGGAAALARSSFLAGLVRFDAGRCNVGDDEAAALAGVDFRRLEELVLNFCPVGDRGAAALAAGPAWPRLRKLALVEAPLTTAGVAALADSRRFPALDELDLRDVPVDEAGCAALAGGRVGAGLKKLHLTGDLVDGRGRDRLDRRFGTDEEVVNWY